MATTSQHLLQLPVRSPEFQILIAGRYAIFRSRLELPISRMSHAPTLRARKVGVECVAKSSHEETELEALVKEGGDNDDEVREDDDDKVVVAHGNPVHLFGQEFPVSRMNYAPSLRARKMGVKCVAKSSHEETELEALVKDGDDNDDEVREDDDDKVVVAHGNSVHVVSQEFSDGSASSQRNVSASGGDSLSLGIREPVYEVVEVKTCGTVAKRKINRRHLLKSSGLRPRDIRSVDPSLWLTNSMPALLVREHAILLNLGSLRAIVMQERVLIFNYNRKGGKAFIDSLLPRLNPTNTNGGPSMPFVLEVVEAALHSRIHRLEHRLWDFEPRVEALLEVLPNRLTADILEELRISKQKLVELGSRAGALKQVLLDILEDTHEIRHICIIGINCVLKKENDEIECSAHLEKEIAEEEEEEIEMLLENYLQRCESCHGQAERLLDSAKEMEDSIAVNLSSRRLEVSRFELILQVGTFCIAVGTLVAGIFGMNLRSYLEEHVFAFWLTTAGIIIGAVLAFYLMYWYLRTRKIL